jgi:hypothetical protein
MPKLVRSDFSSHATRIPRPPPPGGRLDDHGKADVARDARRLVGALEHARAARHERQAGVAHRLLGDGLVAHLADHLGRRTDER